jgi:hypothetical protein
MLFGKYSYNSRVKEDETRRPSREWDEYTTMVGKPGTKRLLGNTRRRKDNNNKIDLSELGFSGTDWIDLA